MNPAKRVLCIILCVCILLPLVGCGQTETAVTEAPPTEATQVAAESYLAIARGFLDKGDYDSAVAVLMQAQELMDDERITALLEEIQGTQLTVEVIPITDTLLSGSVELRSVSAVERNGAVRYSVDYSAPAGMFLHLSNGRLDQRLEVSTTGRRETVVFEMDTKSVRDLEGSFYLKFGETEESFRLVRIDTTWPGEEGKTAILAADELPEEFEPGYWLGSDNAGILESIWVKDAGEKWQVTVSHNLQGEPEMAASLSSGSGSQMVPEDAIAVDPENNAFVFEVSKENMAGQEAIFVGIGSSESGRFDYRIDLPFQVQETGGTPVGEPVHTGWFVEDELKTGSYEIHDVTAQRLNNGYVRFLVDMTLSADMTISAFLNMDAQKQGGNQFLTEVASGEGRKQYCLDIHEELLRKTNYLYLFVMAGRNDRDRFFLNIPHAAVTAVTRGTAVSEMISIPDFELENGDKEQLRLYGCKARVLNNGYVRYTITCNLPKGQLCYFFDPPDANLVNVFLATGPQDGAQTFTVDVKAETAQTVDMFTFIANCRSDEKDAVFTLDNALVADPERIAGIPEITVTLIGQPRQSDTQPETGENSAVTQMPASLNKPTAIVENTDTVYLLDAEHKLAAPRGQNGIEPYAEFWYETIPAVNLSDNPGLAYTLSFSDTTRFPDHLPSGYDPQALLQWGKAPGLNVEVLHALGYTGKGAVIAYVDQPAHAHEAYANVNLHNTNHTANASSMHGPSVLSLLAGKETGTAPDAEVWFYGEASWEGDHTTSAKALYEIIEKNKTLPESEKITMVGFSDNIAPHKKNMQALEDAVKACEEAGIMVWFCGEYASAAFLPFSDKNNFENVIPDGLYGTYTPELVYVPAGSRTSATGEGGNYIYWASGGLSWTMPYVLGLYAIVTEIDPSLSQEDLRRMIVDTAYEKDGMKIVNPVEFVAAALEGVDKNADAQELRAAAEGNRKYTYAVLNKSKMNAQDVSAVENYLKRITDSQVIVVDAGEVESAQELYEILQTDHIRRGGQVAGIQIFGNAELVPSFDIGYKVQMADGVDDAGRLLTDLFYGNFSNDVSLIGRAYNVMDHFANDWQVELVPQWKVARLPLAAGEFGAFFEKYMDFAKTTGFARQTLVNFSNPIFPIRNSSDDMGIFLNRLKPEFGIDLGEYRLYGNQLGQYPVSGNLQGGFTAECLTAENRQGICEFLINTHGQWNNVDKCWFEDGQEKRESLMNMGNINTILGENPYYLDMWACQNGVGMQDNITSTALKGKCVGMFAATHIISNNGVSNRASLQAMENSNFYFFYYHYLKSLSDGASRSDAFFAAQSAYANALMADSRNGIRMEGNYQFNLCNLLAYHNFGVLELSGAFCCVDVR